MSNIRFSLFINYAFVIVTTLLLGACGGGGGTSTTSQSDNPVAETLTKLGVDVSETPREAGENETLPEDYTPLGSSKSFEQFDELVLLGFPLSASSGYSSELTLLELDRVGSSASYVTDVLFAPNPALTPWALSVGESPTALRVAARGDVDRDGLEEMFMIYRASGQSSIELQLYDDQTGSFAASQHLVISTDPADSLSASSGDFNGDGYAELVIGVVSGDSAQLIFIDNDHGVLSLSTLNKTLPQAFAGSEMSLVIKSGNLDYDPSHEFVVLVNELYQQGGSGNPESGTTRYFLFDDAKKSHIEIASALVQADLNAVNRTAIVADVSLGDVDGDNIDEMVFGGLTHFDPNNQCNYTYLLVVLDDLTNDRASLGAKVHVPDIHQGCAVVRGELRFVYVNTPDVDGDGYAEIQANELIFEDFAEHTPWTEFVARHYDEDVGEKIESPISIPQASLFSDDNGFTGRFSNKNSTIVTADLTSDKRQDIVFYSQSTNRLEVWGLSEPDATLDVVSGEWRMLKSIPVAPPASADDIRPLLLPINVNHDSLAISFDEGEYQLVFTEPVIIAALAAAPCYESLGQNTDACRTAYGTAESTSVAIEDTLTMSAGISVGTSVEFNDPITALRIAEIEATVKVKASLSLSHSAAYTYTESLTYTTGPIEDTVIFTSIPYDMYTYTITSHPDPAIIGTQIVVSMPRSPVTLQVDRNYYNANVSHDGPLIDSSVFTHTAGNPNSYPGRSTKDSLMSRYSSLLPSKWAYDFGPTSVGEGGGNTSLE
ncbi:MAG TPA: VCBS repeat-containing protein, partial [Gammaproteobacteria bacterium]